MWRPQLNAKTNTGRHAGLSSEQQSKKLTCAGLSTGGHCRSKYQKPNSVSGCYRVSVYRLTYQAFTTTARRPNRHVRLVSTRQKAISQLSGLTWVALPVLSKEWRSASCVNSSPPSTSCNCSPGWSDASQSLARFIPTLRCTACILMPLN